MKQSHYNELMKIAADLETEGDGAIAKALRAALAAPTALASEAPTEAFKWPKLPGFPEAMWTCNGVGLFTEHQMQGYANAYGEAVRAALHPAAPEPEALYTTADDLDAEIHRLLELKIERFPEYAKSLLEGYATKVEVFDHMIKVAQANGFESLTEAISVAKKFRDAASPEKPLNGIPATLRHDEGAVSRCSYCGRYSLDPKTLSDRQPKCDCGEQHGWSGSFKKPGHDAKWSGSSPQTAAPEKTDGEAPTRFYAQGLQDGIRIGESRAAPAADAASLKNSRDVTQLADWLLTDPQTGERLHFAGPLEPDFLRFSRVRMESKSGAAWTLSARLEEGYLTAAERLANIKRAAQEAAND